MEVVNIQVIKHNEEKKAWVSVELMVNTESIRVCFTNKAKDPNDKGPFDLKLNPWKDEPKFCHGKSSKNLYQTLVVHKNIIQFAKEKAEMFLKEQIQHKKNEALEWKNIYDKFTEAFPINQNEEFFCENKDFFLKKLLNKMNLLRLNLSSKAESGYQLVNLKGSFESIVFKFTRKIEVDFGFIGSESIEVEKKAHLSYEPKYKSVKVYNIKESTNIVEFIEYLKNNPWTIEL